MDENDHFWRLVNTPLYWQDAARDLICGANLLKKNCYSKPRLGFGRNGLLSADQAQEERHTTARAIIVLYAIAAENLLKAIIVAMGKDPIGADGRIQGWFATHDLVKLAEHAGLQCPPENLLRQLAEFTKAGKYPVGLRDGDASSAHNYFPDSVLAGIAALLPTLEARMDEIPARRDRLAKADLLTLCCGTAQSAVREGDA